MAVTDPEPLFDAAPGAARLSPRPATHSDRSIVAQWPARPGSRPNGRDDAAAATNGPDARASDIAPCPPSFVVADHDRDTWRLSDGHSVTPIGREALLACEINVPLLIIESCHLVAQGDFSVSAPFTADELRRLAAAAFARDVSVRTIPNRRIPRAWAEVEPGTPWDQRDKDRDAEIWHRWLSAKPERLASCRHWGPKKGPLPIVEQLRTAIMRDVNMVRQWRQFHDAPQSKDFAARVLRVLLAIFQDHERGRGLIAVTAQLGCPWKPQSRYHWDVLASTHVSNAYCVACDPRTGTARGGLSSRRVRKICGLYANGYPNQVRADLRHHGRSLAPPTTLDRAFVDLAMRFNLAEAV